MPNSNTSNIMKGSKEFWIKNMVCSRCLKVIRQELLDLGATVLLLGLGRLFVVAPKKTSKEIFETATTVLHANDLLDYGSVNHLIRQFKNLLGKSMTDYKKKGNWKRNFYNEITQIVTKNMQIRNRHIR